MKSIWKYALPINDQAGIEMQEGAEILHIDCQGDQPMIWALVDPSAEQEVRRFVTFGTGHPVPSDTSDLRHVGTWLIRSGALVFHTFEKLTA